LAIFAGRPRISSRDKLITDPPPDRVLINPTITPATMITIISVIDIEAIYEL
jgi:hypothetical protein